MGEYNLGEYLLMMGDADAAEPHIERAIALDLKISGDPGRPIVTLLPARLHLYRGDEVRAAAIVERIRDRQRQAGDGGNELMVPSEDVLCAMVELATRDATEVEWDQLESRSERFSVGQEQIEVVEARAIAAQRRGRAKDARGHLERALELGSRIPNAMAGRLRRRLHDLA
jgi:hypothetical protein